MTGAQGALLDLRSPVANRNGKRGPSVWSAAPRKSPRWSAARRAGPRHGPAVPSDEGTGLTARWPPGAAVSAPASCGASLPSICFEAGKNGRRPGAERFPGAL